jgi:tetratricopeptide (TPR) repeat protein
VRHYSRPGITEESLERICAELGVYLKSVSRNDTLKGAYASELAKYGQLLWEDAVPAVLKNRFLELPQGAHIAFSLDEELITVPWELMHDGNTFISLRLSCSRFLRSQSQPSSISRHRGSDNAPVKMLILADPTCDLPAAYREGVSIKDFLQTRRNRLRIDFRSSNIDSLYIKKHLRDYDIVHYAGHSEYEASDPALTGWKLSDGRFTTRDIQALAETASMPGLVFSNACFSAYSGSLASRQFCRLEHEGLAGAFLSAGVRHYIGTLQYVEDEVSFVFAKEFYERVQAGDSIGQAVLRSRQRLVSRYGMDSFAWASYILYGDPRFVFYAHSPAGTASDAVTKRVSPRGRRSRTRNLWLAAIIIVIVCVLSGTVWLSMHLRTQGYWAVKGARRLLAAGDNQTAVTEIKKVIEECPGNREAYFLLAEAFTRLGKRQDAINAYFDYAFLSDRAGDVRSVLDSYIRVGWLYQQQGQYSKAFAYYEKALKESRLMVDVLMEAVALRKLAVWYMDMNQLDTALQLLTKSSAINRERQYDAGHRYNLACDYFDIGLLFSNKDDMNAARDFYSKSRGIFERLRQPSELSDYFFNLGELYAAEKDYPKALALYGKGLEIDRTQGNIPNMVEGLLMIGELYGEMDNRAKSEEYFKQAYQTAADSGADTELAMSAHYLGVYYKEAGYRHRAREYLRQAQEIYKKAEFPELDEVKEELSSLDP